MDSPCIKQTVCKVLNRFQHGKYLVAYVLKHFLSRGDFKSSNEKVHKINVKYANKLYRRPAIQYESDSSMKNKVQDINFMLLVYMYLNLK